MNTNKHELIEYLMQASIVVMCIHPPGVIGADFRDVMWLQVARIVINHPTKIIYKKNGKIAGTR